MDCVFDAFAAHLHHLDLRPDNLDLALYHGIKHLTHGPKPQPTHGAVVPFLIGVLAAHHGLEMVVERRVLRQEDYIQAARLRWQRICGRSGYFGEEVEEFSLQPAIYLMLFRQHAAFRKRPPASGCVMAIQLRERSEFNG